MKFYEEISLHVYLKYVNTAYASLLNIMCSTNICICMNINCRLLHEMTKDE